MINKQSHQLSAVKKRTARVLATCASFLSGLIVATQQFASDFNYSDALGWNVDGWYAPWAIIDWHLQWGNVYPDQFMVAESSGVVVCSALLLGVVIANQVRANSSQSHDKLHGSARWANRRDLEAAGLLKKSRWFGKQKSGLEIGLKLGSPKLVQSHVSCGVEKNPMGLWCRLFKLIHLYGI